MIKYKILYISHSPYINGAEVCLLTLLKHLDRSVFEPVVVFPAEGPLVKEVEDLQIRTYIVPLERWIRYPFDKTLKDSCIHSRVETISQIITNESIQLVHTNTSVIIEGAIAASLAKIPHIWHIHETLVGHPELTPIFPLPLIFCAMSYLSDYIVSVADSVKRQLSDNVENEKLRTIYNGISQQISNQTSGKTRRSDFGLADGNIAVITIGEVTERKGYPAWLEVASLVSKENPAIKFLWAGHASDSALSDFKRKVADLHLEKTVTYLGFRRDVQDLINIADIYISTSVNEAFPMVILEAMAVGKAVIATDCGGTKESILNGITGFIVPVNDVEGLSSKILMLSDDRNLLLKLGGAASALFLEKFTADTYAETFCKLYQTAMTSPKTKSLHLKGDSLIHPLMSLYQTQANNLLQLEKYALQIEQLQLELTHHAEIEAKLANEIAALKLELSLQATVVAEQQRTLAERDKLIDSKDAIINGLYDSLSWKITAPLRKVCDAFHLERVLKGAATGPQSSPLDIKMPGTVSNELDTYPTTMPPKEILHFPTSATPVVSIIIPVFEQFGYTFSCLTSILKNSTASDYEIIIADDCSHDETKDVSLYVHNISHVRNEENLGFLRNCNNAALNARGKYLVFLNNDTNVQKDWLKHLTDLLDKNPDIGMTGSKLVYPDGRLQEAGGIIWNDANGRNYGRLDDPTKPEYNYLKEVDYISGASIMVRKELWDRLHGFDERFAPAYYEDTDLAFSIRNLGYKVVYQPKSVVVHFEGISHGTDLGSGIKSYQVRNKNLFLEKWQTVLKSQHLAMDEDLFLARDKSRNKKTILFIDYQVPLFDQFAGSRTNYMYLRMLLQLGMNVKFIGADFLRIEPYSTALNDLGIETLDGDWYRDNWKQWISDNAPYVHYVLLNKPDPANMFLDFIKDHTDAKILYQGHDLHYLRLKRKYEVEGDVKALSESKKYKDIESKIFSKSDVILTFSSVENDIISESFPGKIVKTVPLYFYEEFPTIANDFGNRNSIMFVGGFAHTPNIDAVSWFCREVLPLVHKAVPDLTLKVIGSNPPSEIRRLASDHVKILGFVTDEQLKQHYDNSRLVVIPLRFGAGVKGKTIEAMYHGLPIVSTSIGIEGIPEIASIISPADEAEDFARQVIEMYQSPENLEEASRKNRDFLSDRYNAGAAQKCIQEIFTEIGTEK